MSRHNALIRHDALIQIRAGREIEENERESILNITNRYKGKSDYEISEAKMGRIYNIYVIIK
ncbi:MAG TPA: hypothetical protein HA232_02795 [Methanocellales archaeon]|nr:hypothetical protein [Methanocellales archaeon]